MTPLLETGAGRLTLLLPAGRDAVAWHGALAEEIGRHLSPAHASVLARPVPMAEGGLAWTAAADEGGGARLRYAELGAEARRALDAALGAILSDIRRLAESGAAPAVRAAWPALREVPDMGHVFAVDGRPVLAGWGHAGPGGAMGAGSAGARLARLDDGVAWQAPPRVAWGVYGAALGCLAAVALAAGLLLPWARAWWAPGPAACMIVPGQLQAMRDQAALESRGAELRTLLATLTEEVGRKQLLCPIAVAPAPVPPAAPRPAPVPAPAPHADLPQERWERRDLGMLEGCWNLRTTMRVVEPNSGQVSGLPTWQMCFDGRGTGRQTMVTADGRRCTGPLAATFTPDGALSVTEPQPCQGTLNMVRSTRICRRVDDGEATCDGRSLEGFFNGHTYSGQFRR